MLNIRFRNLILMCVMLMAIILPSYTRLSVMADTATPAVISSTQEGGEEELPPEEELPEEEDESLDGLPENVGNPISTSVITDKNLYSALLSEYKKSNSAYKGSTIYTGMFNDFTQLKLDNKQISSLEGMQKLELFSLQSLSLNLNELASFDGAILENIDIEVFSSLSIAGNNLAMLDVSALEGLTYLDVSSNNLTEVDLGSFEGATVGTDITINVANNMLDSMEDIVLPTKRIGNISLNIIENNIIDIPETYFTDKYNMMIGVQGFESDKVVGVDTKRNFVVYKSGIPGLAVEIYRTDGDEDELVETVLDSQITTNFVKLNLPVGEYYYAYTIDGVRVTKINSRNDHTIKFLQSNDFNVLPQQALYTFTHKGKTYDNLGKVTGKVTVNLSTAEEGAEIFYSVNGGEWKKGTAVECNEGGNYTIKVKSVINGFESEELSIWVRTSLNLYISDALMLVLVVLLALVLFLVVLPIISKKYFKKD